MAAQAEALGINIFPGFAGASVIYDDAAHVQGVRTGDRGVDKHGPPKGNFEAGIDIRAKVTVLGEGPRGSLSKQLIPTLGLDRDSLPQLYSTGIKELWRMPAGSLRGGRVIHTMGWPLPPHIYGGGFIYNMDADILSVGFVVGLDYAHPDTDPHKLFQQFKTHPLRRIVAARRRDDRLRRQDHRRRRLLVHAASVRRRRHAGGRIRRLLERDAFEGHSSFHEVGDACGGEHPRGVAEE